MKKKNAILLIAAFVLFCTGNVLAEVVEPTISSGSGTVKEDKEIKGLKERLANKVAEIRKKDQKAVGGFAIVKDDKISLKNDEGIDLTVKIDESLTKLYQIAGTAKKEIKSSDIKTDSYLIVTGPIVDTTINANFVFVDETYIVQSGKITEVSKSDFYIKVMSADKQVYQLDIESTTKQNMLNIKTLEIEKTGFSKIKEGDTVHFAAKKDRSEDSSNNRFAAQKILVIPQEYFIK
ncbi:hypothetical protein A2334_02500 [Candidatus Roizmanbacteria bacterium RIFOXYB2_FULL_38_10]|uniref:DUF5666 domain-containing protein n=1 Tax=Candidatus Roizmanbacteria bacterium RIFOXYD1_FULL_38_12 TaxID=1802093 RepID=A0A1F7L065_9BACT|nr:MAG: hypothetical protein A3K47_01470 [Candidatus Roizmanbacteria bacterium RIFOXYA2_FULL_38_14]OGK63453.1 MAG: hypothetical protein A3K27_01470 [Candidatus Roizmanbacteria bacterium RIFOXYA1_FULL_37_12]OGK65299.1 MAG: hypothetical protein A3K38_01470 [Candidatus Roizmanbacteria bacterium RIFOXYB1_FULL_40_23]OGK67987.1 MAG: hypothetical protein A2334_02500 [Candidatus Roizmanbacteria bacterium RIFOXYB2_FULL_38_10]OGK69704.1 MAG: hypothetical protein A3K21_01475 [Candidatus Roizmanbacteria ba